MRCSFDHVSINARQTASLDGTGLRALMDMHEASPTGLAKVAALGAALGCDVLVNADFLRVVPSLVARGRR